MKHNKLRILIGLTLLALAITACALPTSKEPLPSSGETPVAEITSVPPTSTPVPTPTATPAPVLPVGLRQGLASLNSYQFTTVQIMSGPDAADRQEITTVNRVADEGDRTHTHTTSQVSSADDPSGESSTSDRYQVGSTICSLPPDEDGESPVSESDPMAEEMASVVTNQLDVILYVEDPVLVGEEEVNGVQTRHYTFKVTSLGKNSGAEVTQSSGEYWSAVDGNYLVKYSLVLEMRSAPEDDSEAQVIHNETTYDLTMINEPITIEMPADCQ
jgi:hypothetical protein